MDSMIDRLNAHAGHHNGTGDGAESGPFTATIDLEPLLGSLGTSIVYTATSLDGEQLHTERTTVAHDMFSGRLMLFVLSAELSGLGQLSEVSGGVFNNGAGVESFELQITIELTDDELTYIWSWAPPGAPLTEQSRASVRFATA
jgi:hypothetical protein